MSIEFTTSFFVSYLRIGEVVAVRALDALVLVQEYHVDAQVLHGRPNKVAALALEVQPALDLSLPMDA